MQIAPRSCSPHLHCYNNDNAGYKNKNNKKNVATTTIVQPENHPTG